ncbi:GTP-binding protein HflX [Streptococcus pneumoniae]|nr:GTP-binding protein HflX [Streptococcus pneumoniae]
MRNFKEQVIRDFLLIFREKRLESSTFKIGLIGYTNAGKSTIMNILTSKTQYEADELFATLDATTKSIHLGGNLQVTLTDTVGFIKPYCAHIITFRPEMPIPKLILEIGVFVKHHECTFAF